MLQVTATFVQTSCQITQLDDTTLTKLRGVQKAEFYSAVRDGGRDSRMLLG